MRTAVLLVRLVDVAIRRGTSPRLEVYTPAAEELGLIRESARGPSPMLTVAGLWKSMQWPGCLPRLQEVPLRPRGAYPFLSAASAEYGARRRRSHALSPSGGHPRVPECASVGIRCAACRRPAAVHKAPVGAALGSTSSFTMPATPRFPQAARARTSATGGDVHRGREVMGIAQNETGVDVELSEGQSLRADYLVGCDRGCSVIRKAAGIEFPGWNPSTGHLIAEVEMAEELE